MILHSKETISKEILPPFENYTVRKQMNRHFQQSMWHNENLSDKLKLKKSWITQARLTREREHTGKKAVSVT